MFDVQVNTDAGKEKAPYIYAHDRSMLYRIDPTDPQLHMQKVGEFDCLSDQGQRTMTDIAVDRNGELYGVSTSAVFLHMKIDETNHQVHCKQGMVMLQTASGGEVPRFYGLTFAPSTKHLGAAETLIGANTLGELYAINTMTGKLTLVGNLGTVPDKDGWGNTYPSKHVGKNWALSGDIVFLEGVDNDGEPVGFATVRDCDDPKQAPHTCSHVDTLIEIAVDKLDPNNPTIVLKKVWGQILPAGCQDESCGYGSVYGVAAYEGKVFGFTYNWSDQNKQKSGDIISIDIKSGTADMIRRGALQAQGFAGAGITTIAPFELPK